MNTPTDTAPSADSVPAPSTAAELTFTQRAKLMSAMARQFRKAQRNGRNTKGAFGKSRFQREKVIVQSNPLDAAN